MRDYNREMKEVLSGLTKKEKLLLHTCCAVCVGGVLARRFEFFGAKKCISDFFDITLYFFNPNINTQEEYDKRAGELDKLRTAFPHTEIWICDYAPHLYEGAVKGFENGRERGERCAACIGQRLQQTARFAKENGFDRFASTLSVSPHKDPETINDAGNRFSEMFGIPFLPADFKKENGFAAAGDTAKKLDIYRQSYCGCRYSIV